MSKISYEDDNEYMVNAHFPSHARVICFCIRRFSKVHQQNVLVLFSYLLVKTDTLWNITVYSVCSNLVILVILCAVYFFRYYFEVPVRMS